MNEQTKLTFVGDDGSAERVGCVLEFTPAFVRDPNGMKYVGEMVCEALARGVSVYVKLAHQPSDVNSVGDERLRTDATLSIDQLQSLAIQQGVFVARDGDTLTISGAIQPEIRQVHPTIAPPRTEE